MIFGRHKIKLMSINNTEIRIGNFTSSGIADLLTLAKNGKDFGAPALSYIYDCNMERRFGLPISGETDAVPTEWGKALEPFVHEILPMSYEYTSQITTVHPTIDFWAGSADGFNNNGERAIVDIKCPFTRASFHGLVMPLVCGLSGIDAVNAIRFGFDDEHGNKFNKHKQGEQYYQQLVSNAIINNCAYAELIVYMPYRSDLLTIMPIITEIPKLRYVGDRVPFIEDVGMFKNLNIIRFKVPQSDKDLLTETVERAGKMLIPRTPSVLLAPQPEPSVTIV